MCAKYRFISTAQFLIAKYTFLFVFELFGNVRLAWRRVALKYITFSLEFFVGVYRILSFHF